MGVTRYKMPDGRVRYRVRLSIAGERKSLGLFDTLEEAERFEEAAKQRLGKRVTGVTLLAWGEIWLDRREKDPAHRSVHHERSLWRTHIATAHFAEWPIRKIQRTDVVRWVGHLTRKQASTVVHSRKKKQTKVVPSGRKLSRSMARQALALLRSCLNDAADEGHAKLNPAIGVRVKEAASTDEGWTYLTLAEIDAVLAVAELTPAQQAAITVSIYTGLRQGELWGLRWADVHLDSKHPKLVVRHSYRGPTKAGKVRHVPLLRPALEALKTWRKLSPGVGHALVFPAHGGGCHGKGYDAGWRTVLKRAGITRRVRWHDLRHTCASHLIIGSWGKAWRTEDVRQLLGHSSVTVTEKYAHLAPEGLHALAAETGQLPGQRWAIQVDTEQEKV